MKIKFTYTHDHILKLIQEDLIRSGKDILLTSMDIDITQQELGTIYINCKGELN